MEATRRIHTVAVSVNAYRNCSPAEKRNIASLRDSAVAINQWVTFLRPLDRQVREEYLPDAYTRFPIPVEAVPTGDRIILAGGVLEAEGAEVFDMLCRVNSRRMAPIQFHSALDSIGGPLSSLEHEKLLRIGNEDNELNLALYSLWERRGVGAEIYFDGERMQPPILPDGKMSTLTLYWHLSTQGLIEQLSERNLVS